MSGCSQIKKNKGDCRCCKTCTFKLPANAKLWHPGIIMSGCGKPPGTCDFNPNLCCGGDDPDFPSCEDVQNTGNLSGLVGDCGMTAKDTYVPDEDLCQPIEKDGSKPFEDINFLYENWIDTCSLVWYTLVRNERGCPIGYNRVAGDGTVETLNAALAGTHARGTFTNIPSLNEERSFVFLEVPPSPMVVASFTPTGNGETLTPDFVLTDERFGYQVYIRDKRNNRYYRDSYNSHCTEPMFPCDPCDLDCFVQFLEQRDMVSADPVPVPYEFDAEFCRWYLADECEGIMAVLPDVREAECDLACCWNRCGKRIGKNPGCTGRFAAINQENCNLCPKRPKKKKHHY